MANAPRNTNRQADPKQTESKQESKPAAKPETKAETPKQETKQQPKAEVKQDESRDESPLRTPQESRKDEVKADMKREKSALERKADALEKSGGDPAKVAELRHMAPAVRTEALRTTAQQDLGSAPTVRDAEARAAEESAKADQLSEKEKAEGKNPGRKLDATRGQTS